MKHYYYIGIDRSDQTLDICILNQNGDLQGHSKINSSPEKLLAWIEALLAQVPPQQTLAICIEQPCQNLVSFLRQFDKVNLYLVNPALIKRYRESLSTSRAKDDRRDASALAQFVLERHQRLDPWSPSDELADQIALLNEKRRQVVDTRTSLTNKLTQALKDYYPQALDLVGRDLFTPLACALLAKWPTLQSLQKARPETVKKFYYLHGSRRPQVIEDRLKRISSAVPMCSDAATLEVYALLVQSLVSQIKATQQNILKFDALIAEKSNQHEDIKLFTSLPGAGPVFSARILSFFGSDRSKYQSAAAIQKHSGVAPLTKQSGKMHFVHRRYACNKFWRQTFVEWAAQTVMKSLWAKAYYLQQKDKGHRHQSILRSLAYKWQRILFRCWQNHETYSEIRYLKALEKSASPLMKTISLIKQSHPNLCEQFS